MPSHTHGVAFGGGRLSSHTQKVDKARPGKQVLEGRGIVGKGSPERMPVPAEVGTDGRIVLVFIHR